MDNLNRMIWRSAQGALLAMLIIGLVSLVY